MHTAILYQNNKVRLEKNMMKLKENSGITLVALVVTIIVLLILAGITINLVAGKEGLVTTAQVIKANI